MSNVLKIHYSLLQMNQVQNSSLSTTFGQLCKVSCTSTTITPTKQYWEIFVGAPIVIFCLCAKYVATCSMDGTIRFLSLRTGILALPIIKIPTAGVQCAFVSDIFSLLIFETSKTSSHLFRVQTVNWAVSSANAALCASGTLPNNGLICLRRAVTFL